MERSPSAAPSPASPPKLRSVWLTALILAALSVAACLTCVWISVTPAAAPGGTVPAAAALGALAAVVVLALLGTLRRRYHTVRRELVQLRREVKRREDAADRRLEQRETRWREHVTARSAAVTQVLEHLVQTRLPAALRGATIPPAAGDETALDENAAALVEAVLTDAAGAAKQNREREESARLAVVALSRRVQTSAHRIQEEVSLMADRHQHSYDVVESSMRVDHAAAQQGRHAQSVAVLCGEQPGQQWQEPLALVEVVQAGSGRIVAYPRVEVTGDQDVAVTAQAVEPLIHLVAELLANATQCSPPSTQVLVTVRRVQRGAVIEINDCGIGMAETQLEHARELISGERAIGLVEAGEIPQTGLAVVGRYVQRHGFRVDLSDSAYGGVRAVVLVPVEAIETLAPAGPGGAVLPEPHVRPRTYVPAHARDAAGEHAGDHGRDLVREQPAGRPRGHGTGGHGGIDGWVDTGVDPGPGTDPLGSGARRSGLPQRRSNRYAPPPEPGTATTTSQPEPTPAEAGSWMSAFLGSTGDTGPAAPPALPATPAPPAAPALPSAPAPAAASGGAAVPGEPVPPADAVPGDPAHGDPVHSDPVHGGHTLGGPAPGGSGGRADGDDHSEGR